MGFRDAQLAEAIEQHHTEDAIRLLDKISDINYQTHQRCTALHRAVKHNNIAVAAVLLERGASMNILPKNKAHRTINQSPMLLALEMGESHEEMQLLFLRHLKIVRDTWKSSDSDYSDGFV
jgi:ankyrin repeat protein